MSVPARALSKKGYHVKVGVRVDVADFNTLDVFVFANPHATPELLDAAEECIRVCRQRNHLRLIVDLDRDFHHLPSHLPAYIDIGPGNPTNLKRLENLLAEAHLVTASSSGIAEWYGKFAQKIEVIPVSWTRNDLLWDKPSPKRSTLNLGVVSAHTLAKDVNLIKEGIKRLLSEEKQTLLTVGGDMTLSDAFKGVSENRKMFVPFGQVRDYPYLLANYDILLVPLNDGEYYRNLSDLPLLEAGIRRIPWVASSIPAFQGWKAGGMLVGKKGDWYTFVRKLVKDPALRKTLGEEGRQKAETREVAQMIEVWEKALFV